MYRLADTAWCPGGIGLRFGAFDAEAEPAWIDYLTSLEAA